MFYPVVQPREGEIMNLVFRKAGATGQVFVLNGGKSVDLGLAWSGFVSPFSTIAVVPTTPRVIDFAIEALTSDNQSITVTGDIKVTFVPDKALPKFDFTVDIGNGSYPKPWDEALSAVVNEQALAPVLEKAGNTTVIAAVKANKDFEDAITAAVGNNESLKNYGINFVSVSVAKIEPSDEDIEASVGVSEREKIITEADKARHKRQMAASVNARAVKRYEAQTLQKMEEERRTLLVLQDENKRKEAETDAAATTTRLAPLENVAAGKLLGAAIMEMAKGGRIGNLAIGPELLAALERK